MLKLSLAHPHGFITLQNTGHFNIPVALQGAGVLAAFAHPSHLLELLRIRSIAAFLHLEVT
ncbi:hypothetical protein FORC065_2354 [Yersinia enterocolitica]|nr:hypothetical protein FORC065_2354 [Yersinia enterocolitica]